MSEQSKWREWWISLRWSQNGGSSVEKVYFASKSKAALESALNIGQAIHVIEHAALLECQKDEQLLLSANKLLADENRELQKERDALKAETQKLQGRINTIFGNYHNTLESFENMNVFTGYQFTQIVMAHKDTYRDLKKKHDADVLASYEAYLQRNEKQRGDG